MTEVNSSIKRWMDRSQTGRWDELAGRGEEERNRTWADFNERERKKGKEGGIRNVQIFLVLTLPPFLPPPLPPPLPHLPYSLPPFPFFRASSSSSNYGRRDKNTSKTRG